MKARFPGGIGKGFHPAVVKVAPTIKDNLLNTFRKQTFIIPIFKCIKNLNIDFRIIPINSLVESYDNQLREHFLGTKKNVAEENIQARIRGNILMAMSNKFGWMVLATGNKTELALGYCTLYGDMSGGLSVLSDISKSHVYSLSKFTNKISPGRIPLNCIEKLPSAELDEGQYDPFDYKLISPLVDSIIENKKSPFSNFKSNSIKKCCSLQNKIVRTSLNFK